MWTLLHQGEADVAPLVGVYSTKAHPFSLVYEFMDGLDVRQHLRSAPNEDRLKLVLISIHPLPLRFVSSLTLLDDS